MFDFNSYNQLPRIPAATAAFNSKLASSGITLDTLLDKLRPLFSSAEHNGKYGIWLLHHHFDLEDGERMVKRGLISEPTVDRAANIVAEKWSGGGEELEHAYTSIVDNGNDKAGELPPPPSPEFIRRFQEIVGAYDMIDCLGICFAPSQEELEIIHAGYTFLETSNQGRKHVLAAIPAGDPSLTDGSASVFRTTWSVTSDAGFDCTHSCTRFNC